LANTRRRISNIKDELPETAQRTMELRGMIEFDT
jgi:hypothetical protein